MTTILVGISAQLNYTIDDLLDKPLIWLIGICKAFEKHKGISELKDDERRVLTSSELRKLPGINVERKKQNG